MIVIRESGMEDYDYVSGMEDENDDLVRTRAGRYLKTNKNNHPPLSYALMD